MIRGVGVVMLLLGLLFASRRVRPNGFCGVRVPWTLGDDVVWYRTNAVAGQLMLIWGGLLVAFGEASRRASILLLVVPLLVLSLVSLIQAAFLYRDRHGTLKVPAEPPLGLPASSLFLDALLLLVPLAGWLGQGWYHPAAPVAIPVHFDAAGLPDRWGMGLSLVLLHHFALGLWLILAVAVRYHRTFDRAVVGALFAARLGALLAVEALLVASLHWGDGGTTNLWWFLAGPLTLLLAGLAVLAWRATLEAPAAPPPPPPAELTPEQVAAGAPSAS